ncbi:MAG: radical SAM protein [Candidatus Omnitrophota bacterium]
MNYFYGPVPSRRLGFSLGVNLTPKKFCTFNCIYCQIGKTSKLTAKRFFYTDMERLKKQLKEIVSKKPRIDYISISGMGEPTLHKKLDLIIDAIKRITKNKYPVAVITNSSLLYNKEVRDELLSADLIVPSLDAATKKSFIKIDKPQKNITFEKIINGLVSLRKEFRGKIWLEIMLIGGINDSLEEAYRFKALVKKINPDKVQLNLPVRPSGVKITLPEYDRMKVIKKIIGKKAEIVSSFYKQAQRRFSQSIEQDIIKYLKVRPATLIDLTKSLGQDKAYLEKQLKVLMGKKIIKEKIHHNKKYFVYD